MTDAVSLNDALRGQSVTAVESTVTERPAKVEEGAILVCRACNHENPAVERDVVEYATARIYYELASDGTPRQNDWETWEWNDAEFTGDFRCANCDFKAPTLHDLLVAKNPDDD